MPNSEGEKQNIVTVRWNEKHIRGGDDGTSNLILMPSLWNPKTKSKPKTGVGDFNTIKNNLF